MRWYDYNRYLLNIFTKYSTEMMQGGGYNFIISVNI